MIPQKAYFPTLNGWRALSVIGVIMYHGRSGFFPGDSLALRLAAHGDVGVSAFFAISGFLITSLLLQELTTTGGLDLRRFYLRRCFRILPPYYFMLAVVCMLLLFRVIHVNLAELPACLFFYRNYMPLGLDQAGGFYTAHFWSLAVEEHFYLLWPMILLAVTPRRAGKTAFALAMAVLLWRNAQAHFHFLPGLLPPGGLLSRTDSRIDGLLWGCLTAIYLPQIKRFVERMNFSQWWIPLAGILIAVDVVHVKETLFLRSVLLAALVVSTVVQPASLLGRLLEWKPLVWIGSISYSLYLWQELFLPVLSSEDARGPFAILQRSPWNLLAMLACACLSRYLLEIPMTKWGHRLSEPSTPRTERENSHLPRAPYLPA